jgi:ATP-dependent Lhr-like helicase
MRRVLPESVLQEVGRLDPQAIAQVRQEAWPDVRDADELHDVLQTLVALPEPEMAADGRPPWRPYFDQLAASGRAGLAEVGTGASGTQRFWVAAEQVRTFEVLQPESRWLRQSAELNLPGASSRSDAVFAVVNGWMQHLGPTTAAQVAELLALTPPEIEQALLRLEASGTVLRGRFTESPQAGSGSGSAGLQAGASGKPGFGSLGWETCAALPNVLEWCERRLLARIHRLTIGRLRKEIEPATPAEFMRWLLRWQHLAPGTQVRGERGLLEVLQQLQGFEIPANAWERQVLARRVADYDPKSLDQLCLGGAVGWGRLSPHPAMVQSSSTPALSQTEAKESPVRAARRVIPTSVAPITFFVREDADWMLTSEPAAPEPHGLSSGASRVYQFLQQRGASFFPDVVRESSLLKSEVETALWELVAAGLVTADGFDNLRALIDPKRRAGQGHARTARPRHSIGRWSLLRSPFTATSAASEIRARAVESTCRMLLRRYGVLFRELLTREAVTPRWRELLLALRRMEDRGEIRGGRFVSGFLGEQFALPVAVESLRAGRKRQATGEVVVASAADPLNLVGIVVSGERTSAVSGKYVAFRDGVAVEPPAHEAVPVTAMG